MNTTNSNESAMLTVGSVVVATADFTTPIGCRFGKGTAFEVVMVGACNVRARERVTGTLVWIKLDTSEQFGGFATEVA